MSHSQYLKVKGNVLKKRVDSHGAQPQAKGRQGCKKLLADKADWADQTEARTSKAKEARKCRRSAEEEESLKPLSKEEETKK